MNTRNIIDTLIEQLEAEQFMGGKWLPFSKPAESTRKTAVAPISNPAPKSSSPPARTTPPPMAKQNIPIPPRSSGKNQPALDGIAARVAQCQKCDLHTTRTHTVPGEGNAQARIVFVGEAPGGDEDQQGRPFVGRAGQLLTNIINAMGLARQDVYICNVLKCRPPENRDPRPEEIAACIEYLNEQLQTINPDIIIALGAHAAHTLLDNPLPIGQLRGKIHLYKLNPQMPPVKLIATYHPAYVLRNYTQDTRQRVWDDMKKALLELGLPVPEKKSESAK